MIIYTSITSLDGFVNDENGDFDWSQPDAEVHEFANDIARDVRTHVYGRRMYETWYKMTQMVLTGFPLQKVLTHQIHIDDFQKGFDLMEAGQCGKIVCNWN